jgi:hypothetical protein
MPKKRKEPKHLTDLPDKEVIRKLFPKKVVDLAEKVAHEKDDSPKPPTKE